jgi:hypothetical protein
MGLLDEAIREHLELKRRRGADPGAVAREEREVLAPVLPAEPAGPEPAMEPVDSGPVDLQASQPAAADPGDPEPVPAVPRDHAPASPSMLGEETAELDMQAAMDELSAEDETDAPAGPAPGQECLSFE